MSHSTALTPYQRALQDPRWQKRRLQILERDKWRCRRCADTKTELQVHHRWYEPGVAPWDAYDIALLTLCQPCHEAIRMQPVLPVLVKHHAMTAGTGRIPTAISARGDAYVSRKDLVEQTARKLQRQPDQLLRQDYLVQHGGEQFRSDLMLLLSGKDIFDLRTFVEFDDPQGTHWWIMAIALHFASVYDRMLHVQIYQHFAETAVVTTGGQSPTPSQAIVPLSSRDLAPSVSLETVLAQSQQITAAVHELIRVRDKVDVIDVELGETKQVVAQHSQDIADLRARAGAAPGAMIMREFVLTRLRRRESEEQVKQWGSQLSAQLRRARPGAVPRKVWDQLSRMNLNEYAIGDLEQFFLSLGML